MATPPRARERGNPVGPTGKTVGENLRRLRALQNVTQSELSARLRENGRPIPVASIGRIESGERRVEVDDLVALAIALGVAPLALLLPDTRTPDEVVELTGWGTVQASEAWMWGASGVPLVLDGSPEDMELEVYAAHRASHPWWLDAPYVRIADMTEAQRSSWISIYDRYRVERGDEYQATPLGQKLQYGDMAGVDQAALEAALREASKRRAADGIDPEAR